MKRLIALFLFLFCLTSLTVGTLANTADKKELTSLLNENFNSGLYTYASYTPYQAAINQGLSVYEDDAATQEVIDAAVEQLKTAKEGLIPRLDRGVLLVFADELDAILHSTDYILDSATATTLSAAQQEFLELHKRDTLTKEQIEAAREKYSGLTETVKNNHTLSAFSVESPPEDVTIPERDAESKNGLNRVASVRLTIICMGATAFVLGVAACILYFKPPKFLQ